MQSNGSPHYWKHLKWCGGIHANHKFCECIYNLERRTRDYIVAPCCGRRVRFLTNHYSCKKCMKINIRHVDKPNYDLEPQALLPDKITHNVKVSEEQMVTFDKMAEGMNVKVSMDTDQLSEVVGAFTGSLESVKFLSDTITSRLIACVEPMKDHAMSFIAKLVLCLMAVWRAREDAILVVMCIAQFLASLDIGMSVIDEFKDFVMQKVDSNWFGQAPDLMSMFCVVVFVVNLMAFGKSPSLSAAATFFMTITRMGAFKEGFSNICGTVVDMFKAAVDFVTTHTMGYSIKWTQPDSYELIINWCDEVHDLYNKTVKAVWTLDDIADLDNLSDRQKEMMGFWRLFPAPSRVMSIFLVHASLMKHMLEQVSIYGARAIPRVEPTVIMYQGTTGFGKSMITPVLASGLLARCCEVQPKVSWASMIYHRCSEVEFWDGYTGQKCIVYDDFGQSFDTMVKPNTEFMELIRLGNSAPYYPGMARCDSKGRTRIGCHFVLLTGNSVPTRQSIQSCQEPTAVLRRIDFMVKVKVKGEFLRPKVSENSTEVVDFDKVMAKHRSGDCGCFVDPVVKLCVAHYLFDICVWKDDTYGVVAGGQTYEQMMDYIAEAHKKRYADAQKRVDFINTWLQQEAVKQKEAREKLIAEEQSKAKPDEDVFVDAQLNPTAPPEKASLEAQSGPATMVWSPHPVDYFVALFENLQTDQERLVLCIEKQQFLVHHFVRIYAAHAPLLNFCYWNGVFGENVSHKIHEILELEAEGIQIQPHDHFYLEPQIGEDVNSIVTAFKHEKSREQDGATTSNHLLSWVNENWSSILGALKTTPRADLVSDYEDLKSMVSTLSFGCLKDSAPAMRGVVNDVYTDVLMMIRNGHMDTELQLREWLESFEYDDVDTVIELIKKGDASATFLKSIATENTPFQLKTRTTTNRTKFEKVREYVKKTYDSLNKKPFFVVISLLGLGTIAAMLARLVVNLFPSPKPVEDCTSLVNIRKVGSRFMKNHTKHDGLTFDETPEFIYVTLDKGKFVCEGVSGTNSSVADKGRPASRARFNARRYEAKEKFESTHIANSCEDNAISDMERVILKNMLSLYREVGENRIFCGHALMVTGRIMLTFNHLFSVNFDKLVLKRVLVDQEFVYSKRNLRVVEMMVNNQKVDACLVELPRGFPAARDIRHHFSPADMQNDTFVSTRLISVRGLKQFGALRISCGEAMASDEPISYSMNKDGQNVLHVVRKSFHHFMDTQVGDCGAVLLQVGTHLPNKILGIHVAGSRIGGQSPNVACAVTREQIDLALEQFSQEVKIAPTTDTLKVSVDLAAQSTTLPQFLVTGIVDKGATDATQTQLRRSPLYEWKGRAITRPAVLYATVDGADLKTQMVIAKNSHRATIEFDKVRLNNALKETKRKMNTYPLKMEDVNSRCLTIDEVVFGIPGDQYVNSMALDSSPGYPWVLDTKQKGKRDFINFETRFLHQSVSDACQQRVSRAWMNLRTPALFTDHLKDERRLKERQKYMKPRLFSGGPIDYTIVFRQYFGAYIAYCMRNRIKNSIAVGINPHGIEWTVLASYMLERGNDLLAGDFSNYDSTLNGEMLWQILDVVNDWYDDGNDQVRLILWSELVDALHLFRNTVYQIGQGNPSGNPMTTILNSAYQYFAWVYVVQGCGMTACDFAQKCRLVTYGDDNIMSVFQRELNADNLVEGFREIGMELTAEVKTEKFGYKQLSEIMFLKRKFRYDDEVCRYLAPLPLELLIEMTYWYHAGHHWLEVAPSILDSFIRELAHHERDVFDNMMRELCEALRERRKPVPPYEEVGVYRVKMLNDEEYICAPQFIL